MTRQPFPKAESTETLQRAIRFLASQCDGAETLDGVGFSGTDAKYGHALARIDTWTPEMAYEAYKMLAKYQRQLANAGIDYGAISEPAAPVRMTKRETPRKLIGFDHETREIVIMFPFDVVLKEDIKANFRARWSPEDKSWRVPATSADVTLPFLTNRGFVFVDGAEERIAKSPETHETPVTLTENVRFAPRSVREVDYDGSVFVARFEFDFKDEFKAAFQTRRWDTDNKRWTLSTAETQKLVEFAKEHGFAWTLAAEEYTAKKLVLNNERIEKSKAMFTDVDVVVPGLSGELKPFQKVVVVKALEMLKQG